MQYTSEAEAVLSGGNMLCENSFPLSESPAYQHFVMTYIHTVLTYFVWTLKYIDFSSSRDKGQGKAWTSLSSEKQPKVE